MLDVDRLLAEIPGGPPCGPYVEYEQVSELEHMAAPKGGQRLGDKTAPFEEPDWAAVRDRAVELFTITKDLRVAVLLTRALVRTGHIAGLAAGMGLIHALLARCWDTVNPPLDIGADGTCDPAARVNALAPLAHSDGLVRDVRNATLVTGPLGRVTVRDVLVGLGKLKPAEGIVPRSIAELTAAIRIATEKGPELPAALGESSKHVQAIQALLLARDDPRLALSLAELSDMLKSVLSLCEAVPATADANGPASGAAMPAASHGDIRDRDEAVRLLEAVCQFFERTEPTNPGPLFMRRAQRLLNKSFVDIIQDLAPDTLNRFEEITGLKKKT